MVAAFSLLVLWTYYLTLLVLTRFFCVISIHTIMEVPVYGISLFFLAVFNTLIVFHICLFDYNVLGNISVNTACSSLSFVNLSTYILLKIWESFCQHFFKSDFCLLFFLFSFWNYYSHINVLKVFHRFLMLSLLIFILFISLIG
jgi:hypothetical protein